jgi:hypothetical protein
MAELPLNSFAPHQVSLRKISCWPVKKPNLGGIVIMIISLLITTLASVTRFRYTCLISHWEATKGRFEPNST